MHCLARDFCMQSIRLLGFGFGQSLAKGLLEGDHLQCQEPHIRSMAHSTRLQYCSLP